MSDVQNHNGMAKVSVLIPFRLEYRLKDLCKAARNQNGVDYGVTFQRVIAAGLNVLERQNHEDLS